MASQWHYQLFGEEFGPVSEDVIRGLMVKGTLASDDNVRPAGGSWMSVGKAFSEAPANVQTVSAVLDTPAEDTDDADDAEDWYCQTFGQELGPLTFNDLLRFAESGELDADDQIRFGADGKWRRVGSMGRLVAVLPYQAAPSTRRFKAQPTANVEVSYPLVENVSPPPPPLPPAVTTTALESIPEAVEQNWFAWIKGAEYGPSSLLQLQQWMTTGQLAATDFVKLGKTGTWCPPATVTEILARLSSVASAPPPPPPPPPTPVVPKPAPVVAPPPRNSSPSMATVSTSTAIKQKTVPEVKAVPTPVADRVEPAPMAPPEPRPVTTPASSNSGYGGGYGSNSSWQSSVAKTPPKPVTKPRAASRSGPSFDFSAITWMIDMQTLGIGGGVIGVAALVIGFMYMPAGNGVEAQYFKELHAIYVEFQKVREKKGSDAEVKAIADKAEKVCPPAVAALENRASVSRPASQKLFWIAKYRMKEMLAKGVKTRSPSEIECERMLYEVSQVLQLPMDTPKPVESATPKGPVNPNINKGT